MIEITIIALLIFLNAIFVAAEFTLLAAPRTLLERRVERRGRGWRTAQRVVGILKNPRLQDRYIATAQIGITFASLGLGMYGEHAMAGWLIGLFQSAGWFETAVAHGIASSVAVAFLTYMHIVFGEMVPKSLALMHAEKLSLIITLPMLWIKIAMYPLVVSLNHIGNFLLRLCGVERAVSEGFYHTSEDQLYIINESSTEGMLKEEPGRILQDLFQIDALPVHEVMTPRVRIEAVPLGADAGQIRKIVKRSNRTRYPVYSDDIDHITGIVHSWDIFLLLRGSGSLTGKYIHPVPFVPRTMKLDDVQEIMRNNNSRMAVVMDEHGGTAGLVTMDDIFSEIVGETNGNRILKEEVIRNADGTYTVKGVTRVGELGELFGIDIELDEVDTVSGLILALSGRPPKVGDQLHYGRLHFNKIE